MGVTVHFIGAGPGDPELITVRGQRLIAECPVVLFAGSLVPTEIIAEVRVDAQVVDTASLTLEMIIEIMIGAHRRGCDIARVHSGDPSLYGAIGEQIRRLNELGIPFDITPGVPAFAAAAAALGTELTLPGVAQTVILTRTATRSSPMPDREDLITLASSSTTLAIHLSIRNLKAICETLIPFYGTDCPVAIAYRVSWPDQQLFRGTLGSIAQTIRPLRLRRTALILVGSALDTSSFRNSKLYNAKHFHLLRPKKSRESAS